MRRLVRSKTTREFLTTDGSWSKDLLAARKFNGQAEIWATIRDLELKGVDVYYSFVEERCPDYDFGVQLVE